MAVPLSGPAPPEGRSNDSDMSGATSSTAGESFNFPPVTVQHVQNCSFSAWHPTFRSCTLKSVVIPLSEDFVTYLNADGVFLPLDGNGRHQYGWSSDEDEDEAQAGKSGITELPADTAEDTWKQDILSKLRLDDAALTDDTYVGEEKGADEDEDDDLPSFPELQQRIEDVIAEFGAVFPKLNWSSPKDACWVATGSTLKCTSPADVFLLLKSSDFVAHDLGHAFEGCVTDTTAGQPEEADDEAGIAGPEQFDLILRKWYELLPSMEFRCFVKDDQLVGISQRDTANYYKFLVDEGEELAGSIRTFFRDKIRGRFPDPSYVFDVYINQHNRKVWLLDFNPFSPTTDSLLFSWPEILNAPTQSTSDADLPSPPTSPPFRIIPSPSLTIQSAHPAYSMNRLPRDAVDLSNGASIDQFADDWRRMVRDAAL
ncbi:D123-domain-containing protein [Fimicolochytrium jonesii]|uniref:D123-domain-containing protein n=1 Tax=Fimicolochytrium jonesii TaxID=1396493 RepID=UPI0022FEB2F3|nr:D123-domain-containing protein [Fimicolochytrium jonesii]KAI8825739.1 D123-domain-containing protein [Fimicolochytrium jonesii]